MALVAATDTSRAGRGWGWGVGISLSQHWAVLGQQLSQEAPRQEAGCSPGEFLRASSAETARDGRIPAGW